MVYLVPDNKDDLARYFGDSQNVPEAIEVELVQRVPEFAGELPLSWNSECQGQRLSFASRGNGPHAFDPRGASGTDWGVLISHAKAHVEVTSPLVVDSGQGTPPGEGYLEIHPAESIVVLAFVEK